MWLSEGKGARKKGGQILSKKKKTLTSLFSDSDFKFQVFMSFFSPQIVINYGLCVPWKFVNIISFGEGFPASLPYATVYLVSWFSFPSAGSMVQLEDNGPKCLQRNLNK